MSNDKNITRAGRAFGEAIFAPFFVWLYTKQGWTAIWMLSALYVAESIWYIGRAIRSDTP